MDGITILNVTKVSENSTTYYMLIAVEEIRQLFY